jgi:hypothetical protein
MGSRTIYRTYFFLDPSQVSELFWKFASFASANCKALPSFAKARPTQEPLAMPASSSIRPSRTLFSKANEADTHQTMQILMMKESVARRASKKTGRGPSFLQNENVFAVMLPLRTHRTNGRICPLGTLVKAMQTTQYYFFRDDGQPFLSTYSIIAAGFKCRMHFPFTSHYFSICAGGHRRGDDITCETLDYKRSILIGQHMHDVMLVRLRLAQATTNNRRECRTMYSGQSVARKLRGHGCGGRGCYASSGANDY